MRETVRVATEGVGPAFEGLRPGAGRAHVAWVVDAMARRTGVSLVVPSGFDAYVRIHHRIHTGERWADLAPEYLTRGDEPLVVGPTLEFIDGDGNLDADYVDALTSMLANATSTPRDCHYALWQGWGWVHQGSKSVTSWPPDAEATRAANHAIAVAMEPVWKLAAACPVEPWWGGRDMILFDGPIDAVSAIGCRWPPRSTHWRP